MYERTLRADPRIFAADDRRLDHHFGRVLRELRGRDAWWLSTPRRARRAALLDELERYARARRFPRNLHYPSSRMPYFVDPFGTRCAMAHLIESTRETGLVTRVARGDNNAFVATLALDAAFRGWLDHFGLSAQEAARIQPSYCFSLTYRCGCYRTGADAIARGTLAATDGESWNLAVAELSGDSELAAGGIDLSDTEAWASPLMAGDEVIALGYRSSGGEAFWSIAAKVASNGVIEIPGEACTGVPSTTASTYFAALGAGDYYECAEILESYDEAWASRVGPTGVPCSGGQGCSSSGSGDTGLLGAAILAATYGARRLRSRLGL
jgi:hypothetical protein